MKKIAIIMAALAMLLSVTSCGTVQAPEQSPAQNEVEEGAPPTPDLPEELGENVHVEDKDIPSIEETVLLSGEGVTVTATEYIRDAISGDGIILSLRNTTDKDVGVSGKYLIVNDFILTKHISIVVPANDSIEEIIYFHSDRLEAAGIDTIGKVALQLELFHPKHFDKYYIGNLVEIQTSKIDEIDVIAESAGDEIYNKNGIRIFGRYMKEGPWGRCVMVYIDNNTDNTILFSNRDLIVNGTPVESWLYTEVLPGKKALDCIQLSDEVLKDTNIKEVKSVSTIFTGRNPETLNGVFESKRYEFSTK